MYGEHETPVDRGSAIQGKQYKRPPVRVGSREGKKHGSEKKIREMGESTCEKDQSDKVQ